ncbi:MAG: hypothetical protein R3A46_02780 [Thermomicrobiales bacterium]
MSRDDRQGSIQVSMARHLRNVADWRRWRYEDYNRDERNLQCARALDSFADYVARLPEEDRRLRRLAEIAGYDGEFQPGQQTNYAIGQFHFYNSDATFDGFLDHLVDLAEEDFTENGHFGGKNLPPGDDPWS